MNPTLRLLSIAALLALSSPAVAQTSDDNAPPVRGPDRPLNLSLPRNDLPAVNWGATDTPPAQRELGQRAITEERQGSRRAGRLPYGSGFEARQGSGNGGRGMGRGR